jgi:UDP-N-acetylmuramyl tripeptide synthase
MLARDKNPNMLALEAEAKRRSLPFFWDDEAVSVGAGARSAVWPRHHVPAVGDVAWGDLGSIPIALVTGTNGKTTSTRLLARVVREAGIRVGWSSSDGIVIGDRQIEEGDWTGPVAARTVLRSKDVDLAVLETARGGILRRGLAMDWCDAALITNVSEDHGGGYGIDDLAAMTRVKAVPAVAVRKSGRVVLNANDARLVALSKTLDPEVVFFADLDHEASARPVVDAHRAAGGRVVIAEAGLVQSAHASASTSLMRVDEIPITYGGAAEHNVENALAVVAMAGALGLNGAAIVRGLRAFQPGDNPRRGDVLERGGVRVMLDFGHNPEGIRKLMRLVSSLRAGPSGPPGGRLFVSAASAGDRSDHEINEMARRIAEAKPFKITVRELGGYLRGRLPGAVPRLFQRSLVAHGIDPNAIAIADSEVASLEKALAEAQPGDFIVVLIHLEREEVLPFLAAAGFR